MTDLPNPVAPVPALPATLDYEPDVLIKLAREVAMDIHDLTKVLTIFKLTAEQYAVIKELPFFKRALDASIIEWNSATSTPERIKLESAIALENALPTLAARMKKNDENLRDAVETGKLFAKLSGIGEQAGGGGIGEKITISINLGNNETIKLEKDITPVTPSGGAGEIPTITEGSGD